MVERRDTGTEWESDLESEMAGSKVIFLGRTFREKEEDLEEVFRLFPLRIILG